MGIEKIIRKAIEQDERRREEREPRRKIKPRVSRNTRIILEDNKTASDYIHPDRKCKHCQFPLAISWPLAYCQGCWETYKLFRMD